MSGFLPDLDLMFLGRKAYKTISRMWKGLNLIQPRRSPNRKLACNTSITSWPSTKLQNRVNEQSMGVGKYEWFLRVCLAPFLTGMKSQRLGTCRGKFCSGTGRP